MECKYCHKEYLDGVTESQSAGLLIQSLSLNTFYEVNQSGKKIRSSARDLKRQSSKSHYCPECQKVYAEFDID